MQRCKTRNHALHSIHEANEACVHDPRTLVLLLLMKTDQDMALICVPRYKRVILFPKYVRCLHCKTLTKQANDVADFHARFYILVFSKGGWHANQRICLSLQESPSEITMLRSAPKTCWCGRTLHLRVAEFTPRPIYNASHCSEATVKESTPCIELSWRVASYALKQAQIEGSVTAVICIVELQNQLKRSTWVGIGNSIVGIGTNQTWIPCMTSY